MSKTVEDAQRATEPGDLEVHVLPMRRRHLRSVLRIESQVYPRPWSLGLFMSELAMKGNRFYIVAKVRGTVIGYGGLMLTGTEAHVTTLAVDPEWHRRKVGTRLLLTLARAAVTRGATVLTLEVRMGNAPAQQMYRSFGLQPAGIRKNYYVETNEDALVMWAPEIDKPEFAARLAAIDASVPGTTFLEGVA